MLFTELDQRIFSIRACEGMLMIDGGYVKPPGDVDCNMVLVNASYMLILVGNIVDRCISQGASC